MTMSRFNLAMAVIVTFIFLFWIVPEVLTIWWYTRKEKKEKKS
jgi:hypothetical protein